MSFRHVEVLRKVRNEFQCVRACAKHVRDHWSSAGAKLDPLKLRDVTFAAARLEATYIVRLTAAYESIVYECLAGNVSRPVDEKSSGIELTNQLAGWLQDGVKRGRSRVNGDDRKDISTIKSRAAVVRKLLKYRNRLAHRKPPDHEDFSFKESLSALNRMLDLIP